MAIRFIARLLIALYLLEAGLLLVVAPWTVWWSRNYFADVTPVVHWLMSGMAGRLLVGTAGIVTAFVGLSDLRYVLFHRRQDPEPFGPPTDR